ncbi:MAG: prolyl oligopeptidase family serine peptidase [Saprospiraceae bacterium]|nr:prolyl oligopeptidase family serine peptidase [Saprospiraceae bacterium]
MLPKKYKTDDGKALLYNIYFPDSYGKKDSKTPLFLFLHGAGERGDDNKSSLVHVVPYITSSEIQSKYAAVVVVPQCPKEDYWAPVKRFEWVIINNGQVTEAMKDVMLLLDKLLKDPNIDKSRVYVSGLSMGGFGTYDLLSRRPDIFAGGAVICGGADYGKMSHYRHIPLWVFHGAKDEVVPVQFSRDFVKMRNDSGAYTRYTEYPEGKHDVWNEAIRDLDLLPWLFTQRK